MLSLKENFEFHYNEYIERLKKAVDEYSLDKSINAKYEILHCIGAIEVFDKIVPLEFNFFTEKRKRALKNAFGDLYGKTSKI